MESSDDTMSQLIQFSGPEVQIKKKKAVTSPIYFPCLGCREYANKSTSPIILFLHPP